MASRLNPYLTFDGNAREAMEFYQSVLGGELTISTFGEFDPTAANPDGTMHANLHTPADYTIMASDSPMGAPVVRGDGCSMSISGDEAGELRGYWEGLCAGGQIVMPLERQMWGDEFGMVTDRFGILWMVNIAGASPA